MTNDRQEVTAGEDRVLGEPIQWAAFSHRQLYDALHADNEPGKAHERAREWDELAREVESAAEELAQVLRESETGWRGDAADVGRAVMHDLSRRGEDVSRTTQGVGRFLSEQADVMERAKAEMPEPPEVPAEEMYQRAITGGGPSGMIALVTAAAAVEKQQQDAGHQQAVDVMTAMETGSRRVDESTPSFKVAREGTVKVRERLDARAHSGSRSAEPAGQNHGMGSQSSALSGPGEPTAPANQPGGGGAAPPLAAQADGGGPAARGPAPGIGDPNAEATKQFTALSGGASPGLPNSGGPGAQPDSGGPSTGSTPELSDFTSGPAQTASSSASPANAGTFSGGSHPGGSQAPTMHGSGDQQHWNQFSGAHGPNSRNQKWSGSLPDKTTPSKAAPEGSTEGMSGQPVPSVGGAGGGSVPPLSAAGGGAGGGGVPLSPGGSAGVAPSPGGGEAAPTGGGSPSGGGSSSGGTAMGGVPVGGGAAGARQGGGGEDKEYRSPEYLKDQSLFELEERPAPRVIGEKFKKKQ